MMKWVLGVNKKTSNPAVFGDNGRYQLLTTLQMMKWVLGVNKKTSNPAVFGDTGRYQLLTTLQMMKWVLGVNKTTSNPAVFGDNGRYQLLTTLQMMKWVLGVNKTTSNPAVFGDTGRYQLLTTNSKQIIDYYQRIKTSHDKADILELAKDAFEDQKLLQLEWIAVIENVLLKFQDSVDMSCVAETIQSKILSKKIRNELETNFEVIWNHDRNNTTKLMFYNKIKSKYGEEDYLKLTQKAYHQARSIARMRMSAHTLHIETGRYNGTARSRRYCKACCSADEDTVAALLDLPFSEISIETEEHALLYCPEYDNVRESSPISLLNDLKQDVSMVFNDAKSTHKLASFLKKNHEPPKSSRRQKIRLQAQDCLLNTGLAFFSTSFFLLLSVL